MGKGGEGLGGYILRTGVVQGRQTDRTPPMACHSPSSVRYTDRTPPMARHSPSSVRRAPNGPFPKPSSSFFMNSSSSLWICGQAPSAARRLSKACGICGRASCWPDGLLGVRECRVRLDVSPPTPVHRIHQAAISTSESPSLGRSTPPTTPSPATAPSPARTPCDRRNAAAAHSSTRPASGCASRPPSGSG